jgi:hypothetical protein
MFSFLKTCAESASPWAICFHSIVEFYSVVTHPRIWSTPSTPAEAAKQIMVWKSSPTLSLLADEPSTLDILIKICLEYSRFKGLKTDTP